jgi:hypothetical protein
MILLFGTPTATTTRLTTLATFLTTFLLTTLATLTSLLAALILTLILRHHYLPIGISSHFARPQKPKRGHRKLEQLSWNSSLSVAFVLADSSSPSIRST